MPLTAERLIQLIWELNDEAVPRANGQRTGLRWFYGHINPFAEPTGKDATECAWATGLARKLNGLPVVKERPQYPNSSREADLFVQDEANNRWWIEIKGAWKWYTQSGQLRKNASFKKWLVNAGEDCAKLSQLQPPDATHLALIVIGFTCLDDPMANELAELNQRICSNSSHDWTMTPSGGPVEQVYSWDSRFLASANIWSRSLVTRNAVAPC